MSTVRHSLEPLRPGQRLTVQEFMRRWEAMPELKFAELIDGVVYMPSPVQADHGSYAWDVVFWLAYYAAHTPGCDGGIRGTWLMLENAPQPDSYLWIRSEYGGQSYLRGKYHAGAPELAAEICLTSAAYDLGVKKSLYQKAGVQEYMAPQVEEREVRWHQLQDGVYKLRPVPANGVLRSIVFPGLWLNVPALLQRDRPRVLKTLQRGLESKAHATFVQKLADRKHCGQAECFKHQSA